MTTTETKTMTIEEIASWGKPKRVETKNGPRNLRTATPSDDFWHAWRGDKQTLKDAGVSCSKRNGGWQALWWLPLDSGKQATVDAAQDASRATDSDVAIPVPDGLEYLPFQKAGIAYASARKSCLIADEMGLGKTIQTIGVINADESIKKILIVCPASLRLNWRRELEKWLTRPMGIAIVSGGKNRDWPAGQFSIVIINYDILKKHRGQIDKIDWDLLVCDEVHYCKNPASVRTQAVFGHKTRKGEIKQTPIKARRKLYLSGTPMVNRPIELWPLLQSADPSGLGRNFFAFAKKYCAAHKTQWGWDFTGASNLETLQRILRERLMVRRLKEDVLTELPPKRRQVIELPQAGAGDAVATELRAYASHRDYIADLEQRIEAGDDELRQELAAAKKTAFEEMTIARHETARAKVPAVIEHLSSAIESGPVVCFAWHKDVIAEIKEHFGDRAVVLTGETSMEDRQVAVDRFQAGDVDLFIGNIQAAGVGITLTRSSHVVFAELDWVPGNLSQAEDRCHRIGQAGSVLVQHLILEDSLDAEMIYKLISKQEVIERAMDRLPAKAPKAAPERPVVDPVAAKSASVSVAPDPKDAAAEALTTEQRAAIHTGLRRLAGMCDGAVELDRCGFNKFDSEFGKKLANLETLSPRQALAGQKMCVKYARQLGDELVAIIKGQRQHRSESPGRVRRGDSWDQKTGGQFNEVERSENVAPVPPALFWDRGIS